MTRRIPLALLPAIAGLLFFSGCAVNPLDDAGTNRSDLRTVSVLWSAYKYRFMDHGRVLARDENNVTTSEGQSYALLRAVWANDRATFDETWRWTRDYLQTRGDALFVWKWKNAVIDRHSATDADQDVALALILAARRWEAPQYLEYAKPILNDIWNKEVLHAGDRLVVTAGDWAATEAEPLLHTAYFAPYAYRVFARVDPAHPWLRLVDGSYSVLAWIYETDQLPVPPETLRINPRTGALRVAGTLGPGAPAMVISGYDIVPIFWRVALDARWFGASNHRLAQQMLKFYRRQWKRQGRIFDHYTLDGRPLSQSEGLPLYATLHTLARYADPPFARELNRKKLQPLWKDLPLQPLPYYAQNWLWFDAAIELDQVRRFDEFLGFLRPFNMTGFLAHFPVLPVLLLLTLYPLAKRYRGMKLGFMLLATGLCLRYLYWRAFQSLNFVEPLGPFISVSLLLTEMYYFASAMFLWLQVGLGGHSRPRPPALGFAPSLDIMIPIYSEPVEILEKTLIGALHMRYPDKTIHICDDSRRDAVVELAAKYGVNYIRGPREHAKAGNLNNALKQTSGELVVVFDTDHIPMTTFLEETVPHFIDPQLGFLQTPHHFYNEEIFRRALRLPRRIPDEADLFNHAIQSGRDAWGGAFFVGSGGVFRRRALEELGGFKLLSITEDIHTSQHLHARGWKSAFVNKDLAVGLNAENLASYLTQRRRWMLGSLQILLRDNPLLTHGAGLRHRIGYVASLSYFLFPIARTVLWMTPLYYLLFHLHPILADVSELMGYGIPFVLSMTLIGLVLLPGWPRPFWGEFYEAIITLPLLRSMVDLFLPKRLGFKVTPKGIQTDASRFDWQSAWMTVAATGVIGIAMLKGAFEFFWFGIEKDAYFFNLGWAGSVAAVLIASLVTAWERPQRRVEDRIFARRRLRLRAPGFEWSGVTDELSLTGLSFSADGLLRALPELMEFEIDAAVPLRGSARLVYCDRSGKGSRGGLAFDPMTPELRADIIRSVFADPATWAHAHEHRVKGYWQILAAFFAALLGYFRPFRRRQRRQARRPLVRRAVISANGVAQPALTLDQSSGGLAAWVFGPLRLPSDGPLTCRHHSGETPVRWVYAKRYFPGLWRLGFRRD
jgi:cellulose synthase (UDP-forming)